MMLDWKIAYDNTHIVTSFIDNDSPIMLVGVGIFEMDPHSILKLGTYEHENEKR